MGETKTEKFIFLVKSHLQLLSPPFSIAAIASMFLGLSLESEACLGFAPPEIFGRNEADEVEDVDEEKEEFGDMDLSIPYLK